jgi:hypothetical protein
MKNDNAFASLIPFVFIVLMIVMCALCYRVYLDSKAPRYTEEITIAGTESGTMDDPYLIISTDNIEYKTGYTYIYTFATSHIGQRVRLVYVAGNNNECYVTEIHLITNHTVCTVDKCGTPIEAK